MTEIYVKTGTEKSFTLLGDGKACGILYGAAMTDDGACPAYMAQPCSFGGVPQGVECGYLSSSGDMFLYAGGSLYAKTKDSSEFILYGTDFVRRPYFIEYDGKVTICDGGTYITYYPGGDMDEDEAACAICGGVVHYDRLFGIDLSDSRTVRWSAAGTVDDWSEGLRLSGWLTLPADRGGVLQLVPYDGKLIAVRESGLSVIKAYGDTENFRIAKTDTDTPSVVQYTAAVCAGKLFFAAEDGLYSYDGDFERVAAEELDKMGQITFGAACGNTYFGFIEQSGVIACINGEGGGVTYCTLSPECIFARGQVYAVKDGTVYNLTYPATSISWKSGYTDFGESGRKFLKYIIIDCGEDCDVTVENGVNSRIFTGVKGKVSVKMAGVKFCFNLTAPCRVKSVTAVYEV